MQIKKIFLASSEELLNDRRAFELMIGRLNPQWRQRDTCSMSSCGRTFSTRFQGTACSRNTTRPSPTATCS